MPDTPTEQEHTSGLVDPLIGRVLAGRFRILECIAQGGMGRIYRAEQAPLGRTVAVKVLHLDARSQDDGNFRERFFREASVCARLSHPNTVRIFDYGTEDGVYFIAMEFLEGRTLNDLVRKEGPLPPDRTIHIVRQICRSLEQAHGQGVIHRDLKPANVFLALHGDEEFVKVLDFGLVKAVDSKSQVTRAGNILGSPAYMSPEQVLGDPVTPGADIYALGIILYACLTRTLPFKRDNPLAVLNAQAHAEPPTFARVAPNVDIPSSLEWIVMRCLEKKPEARFASMAELERALRLAEKELLGGLSDFDWQLTDGRLEVPSSLEESSSQVSRPLRPSPPVADTVQDAPSSPTLNVERPTGLRDFIIAAVAVLLLGFGAIAALAVGFFLALQPEAPAPEDPVAGEPAIEPTTPEQALFDAGEQEEPAAEAEEAEPEDAEEAAEVEPETAKTTSKPKTTTKSGTSKRKSTRPKTTSTQGAGERTEPVETTAPSEPEDPVVEEADPIEEGTSAEQEEDDWGSVKPASDLKDPWAE